MNLKCIVTDDEPIAVEILEDYIAMVPALELIGKCSNALETMAVMRKEKADILFIDIQMPVITGIDYIKTLKNPPFIILTTAYPQFAVEGFELDVTDYLLKPINFDRFLKAVEKIFATQNIKQKSQSTPGLQEQQTYFFARSGHDLIKVDFSEIRFIESMQNYVRINCDSRVVTALAKMTNMENLLPTGKFLRIHRSYIVNLEKVTAIRNMVFAIDSKELDTGTNYRKGVREFLEKAGKF